MVSNQPRIAPGRIRELGPVNWLVWQIISAPRAPTTRTCSAPSARPRVCSAAGCTTPGGSCRAALSPRYDTELVILRVAHLRDCEYETDHHIRLGKRAGITQEILERLRRGPADEGWNAKERALLTAVDQLVTTRDLDDAAWKSLAEHYSEPKLIEFVLLVNQYEGLASTITALRIQPDH